MRFCHPSVLLLYSPLHSFTPPPLFTEDCASLTRPRHYRGNAYGVPPPGREKKATKSALRRAATHLTPLRGLVGGVWAHGLTEIKGACGVRSGCVRWAFGGRWAFCRQPCVFGALRASTRPVGDAPSLRFGRGQTAPQTGRAPALAPLGRGNQTPKKSYHPHRALARYPKTPPSGLSRRTSEVLVMHQCTL